MKRDRKISLSEMRKLLKELRDVATNVGYSLRISRHKMNFPGGDFYPPCASGHCDTDRRKLFVHVKGRPARRDILFVIAHEVRHSLHATSGLFADYYKPMIEPDSPNYVPYDEKVAHGAELDCDAWADEWLKKHSIKPTNQDYRFESTMAYRMNRRHEEIVKWAEKMDREFDT